MTKPPSARVTEFQHRYIDALEGWIEIAVFNEEDIIELIQRFDFAERELTDYKNHVVGDWPGIPSKYKSRLSDPVVRDEIYKEIINLNPVLHPKNAWSSEIMEREPSLSEEEMDKIRLSFSSRGTMGPKIKVIHGNGS